MPHSCLLHSISALHGDHILGYSIYFKHLIFFCTFIFIFVFFIHCPCPGQANTGRHGKAVNKKKKQTTECLWCTTDWRWPHMPWRPRPALLQEPCQRVISVQQENSKLRKWHLLKWIRSVLHVFYIHFTKKKQKYFPLLFCCCCCCWCQHFSLLAPLLLLLFPFVKINYSSNLKRDEGKKKFDWCLHVMAYLSSSHPVCA